MQPTDTPYPRRWQALGVLSLALLVISLDNTILNVALPSIQRDLGASSSELQWITDSYMLVFAGLLLAAGSLGDRFGRRKALFAGMFIFGAASVASAFAETSSQLIATRAVMGIGGALIMPTTLSILTNIFPADERPKAIGIWAAVSGLGIAIGPISGGAIVENIDWSWVFWINVPVAIAVIVAGAILIPESKDPEHTPLDFLGIGLSIAGLTSVVWAIIEAPARGWTDGGILLAFGLFAVLAYAFIAWELRAKHPMLDVRLFQNMRFSASSVSIGLVFFTLMGVIFFLTQYMQEVMDYNALEAGLRTAPIAIGLIAAAPLSMRLTKKLGTRTVVAAGITIVAGAQLMMSGLEVGSGYSHLLVAVMIQGFGVGLAMAPATEAIMSSLPKAHAGVGSAMNDTVRQVGGTLGVAVLGSILSSGYGSKMDTAVADLPAPAADTASDGIGGAGAVAEQLGGSAGANLNAAAEQAFMSGMHNALLVAAGIALVGALVAWIWLPGREAELEQIAAEADRIESERLPFRGIPAGAEA